MGPTYAYHCVTVKDNMYIYEAVRCTIPSTPIESVSMTVSKKVFSHCEHTTLQGHDSIHAELYFAQQPQLDVLMGVLVCVHQDNFCFKM